MAEDQNEAAKKRLADAKEVQEKTHREYEEKSKGKPTPTQEENDRAAMGEHVIEKEPDGKRRGRAYRWHPDAPIRSTARQRRRLSNPRQQAGCCTSATTGRAA